MLEIIKIMALQIAREIRSCPPPPACHGEAYQQHLEVCQSCRNKQSEEENFTPWKDLADSLSTEKHTNVEPRVGQIRFVDNRLAGWGANKNFYQSPMVILLEEISGTNGYQVAQVYSDETLQGPDDIVFEELGGFAEPWNVYTLHKKHFGECLGEVCKETVITIWNKFIEIVHSGGGEVLSNCEATSLNSTEHDILMEFRSLEYLVSSHVAKQSVALLLEEQNTRSNVIDLDKYRRLKNQNKVVIPTKPDFLNNTGMRLAASSSGTHVNTYLKGSSKIELTVKWDSETIYIKTTFRGDEYYDMSLFFMNPDTDEIYKCIDFDSEKGINLPLTSDMLNFMPYEHKWTIRIGFENKEK